MANTDEYLDKIGLTYLAQKLDSRFTAIENQMPSKITGITPSTTTGAMELWSQNLNSITKTGFYNAMTCTNAKYPYSTLIVIGYYLTGYCTQIQVDVTTGAIATRSQINGTWSSWKVLSTTVTSTYDSTSGNVTITT